MLVPKKLRLSRKYISLIANKNGKLAVPRCLEGAFLVSSTRSRLECYVEMSIFQMDDRLFPVTPGHNLILPIHTSLQLPIAFPRLLGDLAYPRRLDSP